MKIILRVLMLALLLQSFQCEDDVLPTTITPEQLDAKKTEITNYINSFSCDNSSGCNSIAFGAKPCGGPREYLVFSNEVDLPTLQQMVDDYNSLDDAYNIQTGAVSDCEVVTPPTNIGCIDGVCTIMD